VTGVAGPMGATCARALAAMGAAAGKAAVAEGF
jgi:hypothetical protein